MVMGELEQEAEVLVIGSGPGGYAAAFRAADLGLDVTMVDTARRPGGVCLYHGCIPSKTLLFLTELIHDARRAEAMGVAFGPPRVDLRALRAWKARVVQNMSSGLVSLSRRRGVQLIRGRAQFENSRSVRLRDAEISRIRFRHAIIATGSRAAAFKDAPFTPDGPIMSSRGALTMADIPERLLIVGGGYVGLEIGSVYAALGSRVSLVEMGHRLLPGVDADLVKPLQDRLASIFQSIHLDTQVEAISTSDRSVQASIEGRPDVRSIEADKVLVAIGRRPASQGMGLENTGVQTDDNGFVIVDEQQRTAERHIFAVGDVTGGLMLAHKASHEGKVAAEVIAGQASAIDARARPAVVYTDPQIAWCGITETAAREANRPVEVRRFPWKYSGRAATMGAPEGLTKIIIEPDSGRILGAGLVGRDTEALIAEAVLAIEMGAQAEDMALSIHPHPTLSETEAEAAELYTGTATHILAPQKK